MADVREDVFTQQEASALLEKVLNDLLDPALDAEQLGQHFTRDYQQEADGAKLDYDGFTTHARSVKQTIASVTVTTDELIVSGPMIAEIHTIDATKHAGRRLKVKVIGFFTIRDGKICRVAGLTHLLEGAAEDRDIGHRTH
jgi:ketosteroid isomerase-like protein